MIKDKTNFQNIPGNNQLNSNRTRISINNFQNEINQLLEQQELLESDNSVLKQRLVQKNEDLLLKLTNSLPKQYTDNFLLGLKRQSLHLDLIGDIAMSNTLNDQFEATCSKQAKADIINLRSIIHIQREKLKTSEAKILELNDFIRQQDSLLTQTKELLKAKCAKIQLIEEQLQDQNALLYVQQQEKQQQNQILNCLKTEEEELEFAFQLDETRRSNMRGVGYLGANSCSLPPSEIIENRKDNTNFINLQQYQGFQTKRIENNNSQVTSQRVSIERCNSSRILQNNKNIMNKDNNVQNKVESVQTSSRSKSGYSEIHKQQENIRKSQEKQYHQMENMIINSKLNNSPILQAQPNNQSQANKQSFKDQFQENDRLEQNNLQNQGLRFLNFKDEPENQKPYNQIQNKKFQENQQNSERQRQENLQQQQENIDRYRYENQDKPKQDRFNKLRLENEERYKNEDRCKQITHKIFNQENIDRLKQENSECSRQDNSNRYIQQNSNRARQDDPEVIKLEIIDQNRLENTERSRQERSNSMKQLNQYILMKQKNQLINNYGNAQNNNQEKQICKDQQYQINNNDCLENSPVKIRKEYFQISKQNINSNQQIHGEECVNKNNKSFCNNYNSYQTTESDFNVSYFLNQKLQQKTLHMANNEIQKNKQQSQQQIQINTNSNNYKIPKENNSKICDGIKVNYTSNQNDQSHQSLFSNINFSNVFDMANGIVNSSSNNFSKPSNMSTLKTFNSINNQSDQQIYQPPLHPQQKNQQVKSLVENKQVDSQLIQFGIIEQQNNILSSLETDPNQNTNKKVQLCLEDDKRSKNHKIQQNFQENQKSNLNQNGNKSQCDLPISIHNRNRSSTNYFNIYDQKTMNQNTINQDQQTRILTSLNARTEYSNIIPVDQLENKRKDNEAHSNIVQPFHSNQALKTDITPHKRQSSQSNCRRRSRAERLQKSTSSIKVYSSNDYNTFNPLN